MTQSPLRLQLQAGGNLPMLGNIPSSPVTKTLPAKFGGDDTLESSPLINDPRSAGAESFRSLRTAIQVASQAGRLAFPARHESALW